MEEIVKARMSERRFRHTLGVIEAAQRLAQMYGVDVEKARLAALLHDITKEDPVAVHLEYCNEFSISLSKLELCSPKLYHALTGAAYARHRLGVTDADVLQAIRLHTTGREDMKDLDKVLYLADYIEVNRTFDGVEAVRALIDKGLDAMMVQAMRQTIYELVDKSVPIHPDTFSCYNYLLLKGAK